VFRHDRARQLLAVEQRVEKLADSSGVRWRKNLD